MPTRLATFRLITLALAALSSALTLSPSARASAADAGPAAPVVASARTAESSSSVASLAEPITVSAACTQDPRRRAACGVVVGFFRSVNSAQYERACALLGRALLAQTGGASCPRLLAADGGRRYAIRGVRTLRHGTGVVVGVWFTELDHLRELRWRAVVAQEAGRLSIVETRRIA